MQRILVTGATGFVGSHVLEALMSDPSLTVVAACRRAAALNPHFQGETRVGDLTDPDYLSDVVRDIDVICHAAAWTSLWNHRRESLELFLTPSLKLIAAAKRAGVGSFLFPSTTSAAAPERSADAMSAGIPRDFWPHLSNVVTIENELRRAAEPAFQTTILRLGIFCGKRYGLGMFPILLPRLKTHLVPWVARGVTRLPLIDGRDIARAFLLAVKAERTRAHESLNIVGAEQPTVREVIEFVHQRFGYPSPHFSVPFSVAYAFAWIMEKLDPLVPWDPLVTRSIVHLLEDTSVDNIKAEAELDYEPMVPWRESVAAQIEEILGRRGAPMPMAVRTPSPRGDL